MRIVHSQEIAGKAPESISPALKMCLEEVSENSLKAWVRQVAKPRHFLEEPEANRNVADWLAKEFAAMGYLVERQGASANVVASRFASQSTGQHVIVLGAHFDSVPRSPGADDNGSAIAAMLGCAAALAKYPTKLPVVFVGFNREEDGFVGSSEFVEEKSGEWEIVCAHILEMVGYASHAPGSQRLPTGLPIQLRDRGDFLGLLANERSSAAMRRIMEQGCAAVPELPISGLEVVPGAEKVFPVLARSDHVPFWRANIPAVMWTDTAEFRNPNYHRETDTPETLDYLFLKRVTQALITVLAS
jgi:Zn-dependent M28 family amino/carboxypeptidase